MAKANTSIPFTTISMPFRTTPGSISFSIIASGVTGFLVPPYSVHTALYPLPSTPKLKCIGFSHCLSNSKAVTVAASPKRGFTVCLSHFCLRNLFRHTPTTRVSGRHATIKKPDYSFRKPIPNIPKEDRYNNSPYEIPNDPEE